MEEKLASIFQKIIKSSHVENVKAKYANVDKFSSLELNVISFIAEKGKVRFKDITTALDVPKSTLTNLINRLENKEILVRESNPDDKRSYLLTLTEKGAQIQKDHKAMEKEIFSKMLTNLSNKDKKRFVKTLNKIANDFNN